MNEKEFLKSINIEVQPQMAIDIFEMARKMHDIYEEESKIVGWKTQESCKVEFDKLPEKNKKVMLRTCARIIDYFSNLQNGEVIVDEDF